VEIKERSFTGGGMGEGEKKRAGLRDWKKRVRSVHL